MRGFDPRDPGSNPGGAIMKINDWQNLGFGPGDSRLRRTIRFEQTILNNYLFAKCKLRALVGLFFQNLGFEPGDSRIKIKESYLFLRANI